MEANTATGDEAGNETDGTYTDCVRCGDEFLTHNDAQTCCADCSAWRFKPDVNFN